MPRRSGHDKFGGQTPRDGAELPPALIGIQARPIQLGTETKFLPDLTLADQNGRKVRFYTDLIKDKTVVISFFYTSCTYTCLMQGEVFSRLQTELGERLGREIFLISVSVDPETDTPKRLRMWGAQRGRRDGWTLVTGSKADMAKLVGHLTGNPLGRIEMHSPFVYIGNDSKNNWTVEYGLAEPKTLVRKLGEL